MQQRRRAFAVAGDSYSPSRTGKLYTPGRFPVLSGGAGRRQPLAVPQQSKLTSLSLVGASPTVRILHVVGRVDGFTAGDGDVGDGTAE